VGKGGSCDFDFVAEFVSISPSRTTPLTHSPISHIRTKLQNYQPSNYTHTITQQARALETEFRLHQEDSTRALSLAETKWQRADEELRELRQGASASKEQHERTRRQLENTVDTLAEELASVRAEQIRAQQSASAESAAADASRRALESRASDADEKCADAEKRADSTQRELLQVEESWRTRVATLRRELREARDEVQMLQARAREELRHSAEKAEKFRLVQSGEAEKRSVVAAALSAEVTRLGALVERLRDEATAKDGIKKQLEADVEQLRGTIAVHSRAADVAQAGRHAVETRNSSLDAELQRSRAKCEAVEESRGALEVRLRGAEMHEREARRMAEEASRAAERARSDAAEKEVLLRDAHLNAEKSQRAWELRAQHFDEDLQSLRDSESGARMARDTAQECLRAAEKEVAALAEALRSRSTTIVEEEAPSPSMVEKEAMAKAVLEAETRAKRAADAEMATLVKVTTAELRAAEDAWAKRLSEAQVQAQEAQAIAVSKVKKDAAEMAAGGLQARHELDRELRDKQRELAVKVAEAGALAAELQRLQIDLRETKAKHTRGMQQHVEEKEAAVAELACVKIALVDTQQQLARVEQAQRASEQACAALERDLAAAVEEECACVPCKCLQGCEPRRGEVVSNVGLEEEVGAVGKGIGAEAEATVALPLAEEVEAMWRKRVEDRDRVLERQAMWRQKHMDEEMKLVDTVNTLRQRIKALKRELTARIDAVELVEAKVRRLEEEGKKTGVEQQDARLVATPSGSVAPAAAIKAAVLVHEEEEGGIKAAVAGGDGDVGMVEVLQHALGKLQAEFSAWRIQHDTRTGAALNH
jgi:hypothetical protein